MRRRKREVVEGVKRQMMRREVRGGFRWGCGEEVERKRESDENNETYRVFWRACVFFPKH